MSNRVELNKPAPSFTLADFKGCVISQTDFSGKKNILLVFNRGFS